MNSRERVIAAINHKIPDRVPLDIGGSGVTGISVSTLSKLKEALGLPGMAKVADPFFMLGEVEEDVRQALQIDVVNLSTGFNNMGFPNTDHKVWKLFDGTEVLLAGGLMFSRAADGSLYYHPGCDFSEPPSARMPAGGFYFDAINRQGEIDEEHLHAREDFAVDFKLYSEQELLNLQQSSEHLYNNTSYAILGSFFKGGLGDFGALPAFSQKTVKGIRKPDDWLAAHYLYPDYVKEKYEMQTEIALENLKLYKEAVGERIQAVIISATDFGTQRFELISPDMYREFYKPYHTKMNRWVHAHTNWKVFFHSCGSIVNILDDFVEAGVDILNPVQCTAAGMSPEYLKNKYGGKLVFWGGGADTQGVLQFGTPEEVKEQALSRLEVFAPGGGYIFNPVHDIQPMTPPENILAFAAALREYNAKHTR